MYHSEEETNKEEDYAYMGAEGVWEISNFLSILV